MPKRKKRVTLHDVARQADVSVATVSYSLDRAKASRITPATRQRVLDAVDELGYVPHESARNLRRRSTNRICLAIPRLGVPFYDALADELQREGAEHGLHLIVTVGRGEDGVRDVVQHLQGGLADALVMVVEQRLDPDVGRQLDTLAGRGVSGVILGNHVSPEGFDVVSDTDAQASRDAVAYLVERGHRRIGCLALEVRPGERHERYDSYLAAMADAGIAVDERMVRDGAGNRQRAYAAARELLREPEPPTAIFACTDVAALSTIRAARDEGLHVPGDLAVVGAGDIAEGEYVDPPLTTVGPETREFRDVAELLFSRLRAREPLPGRRLVKRWELKLRGSA